MQTKSSLTWLAVLACSALPSSAHAFPQYPDLIPNQVWEFSPQTGDERPCITCHNNVNGGQGCIDGSNTPGHTAPCFNPFGQAFKDNQLVWNPTLANADADGDGFTNGQELQEPTGTWQPYTPKPGNPAYVTKPGLASDSPGNHDADGDRVCWFGRDLNGNGHCNDEGEPLSGFDCNDALASAHSLATEICTNDIDNDCDGLPPLTDPECGSVVDNDGDGFCETGRDLNEDRDCVDDGEPSDTQFDCDDTRATVYWGAPENCIDGLDNDCNGDVDFDDAQCDDKDDDGDGYCPIGWDENGDGVCDAAEVALGRPGDCYDVPDGVDPASKDIHPDADELCTDGVDNDCNGHVDFADPACRHLADVDGDGYCPEGRDLNGDGNCTGPDENTGDVDCDDENAERSPGKVEICYDGVDRDCDGLIGRDDPSCSGYVDVDGDGFCAYGEDINKDGDCLDANQFGVDEYLITLRTDCDESSAVARPRASEVLDENFAGCFDGLDTDCDGEADGADFDCRDYADSDGDGYCTYGVDGDTDGDGVADGPKDGDCTDPGEAKDRNAGAVDCQEGNAAVAPGLQENCTDLRDNNCNGLIDKADPNCFRDREDDPTDYPGDNDQDGDGYCPLGTDLNQDGDCNDPGENLGSDCDDTRKDVNSGVQENAVAVCRDGLDNDCDGRADLADTDPEDCALFLDQDGDTYCPRGRDNNFNGRCLEGGEQNGASDCDDTTPLAFPGRREVCDDGLDNDCNGKADAFDADVCECSEDAQCNDATTCDEGTCRNRHCVIPEETSCSPDAGPSDPDGGMEPEEPEADAGMMGGPGGDGGVQTKPPPKPKGCSAVGAPAGAGLSGLAAWALLMVLWVRRRSKV